MTETRPTLAAPRRRALREVRRAPTRPGGILCPECKETIERRVYPEQGGGTAS
jgi:hypothetical protein